MVAVDDVEVMLREEPPQIDTSVPAAMSNEDAHITSPDSGSGPSSPTDMFQLSPWRSTPKAGLSPPPPLSPITMPLDSSVQSMK